MTNSVMVGGPARLMTAAMDTAEPLLTAGSGALVSINQYTPPTGYELFGMDYFDEDGIRVNMMQTMEEEYVLNSNWAQKAFRVQEGMTYTVNIKDLSVEALAFALHGSRADITTVAATAGQIGTRKIKIERGPTVHQFAAVLRGLSPYLEAGKQWPAQIWTPSCYVSELGEFIYHKRSAILPVTIKVLGDSSLGVGYYYVQDADTL